VFRCLLLSFALVVAAANGATNIVLIYADDLGYGELGCYGATKVKTPNIDKVAKQGLRFTDAHATSATCTPSRYALLTGEYPWRRKGTGVLPGDAPLIIKPGRETLASVLKKAGYVTGVIGKWHLGLGAGNVDWNGEIKPGPLEIGFDYSFLIPATGDRVPCVYVENHHVVGIDPRDPIQVNYTNRIGNEPTGKEQPDLLKMKLSHGHDMTIVNGISRIGYMSGGKAARWVDEDIADVITRRAVKFIEEHESKPFFLFFATQDVHVPRTPHARFRGRSQCGLRGDVIQEFDWSVGEIVKALDRLKLAKDTILIVTSDNGPVLDDGYADGAIEDLNGHKPAGSFRGGKYSLFEAGTRVPFIVRWPGRVKPGVSDALISQIDLFASLAQFTNQKLAADAAPDSEDVLAALLGKSKAGRDQLVEHANGLGLRKGNWKFIPAGKGQRISRNTNTETGVAPEPQLYDLRSDPGETNNVAAAHGELVETLASELQKIRSRGFQRELFGGE
jgi:arylsulfatase A-like enzyme